jgi:hypothetical protein
MKKQKGFNNLFSVIKKQKGFMTSCINFTNLFAAKTKNQVLVVFTNTNLFPAKTKNQVLVDFFWSWRGVPLSAVHDQQRAKEGYGVCF